MEFREELGNAGSQPGKTPYPPSAIFPSRCGASGQQRWAATATISLHGATADSRGHLVINCPPRAQNTKGDGDPASRRLLALARSLAQPTIVHVCALMRTEVASTRRLFLAPQLLTLTFADLLLLHEAFPARQNTVSDDFAKLVQQMDANEWASDTVQLLRWMRKALRMTELWALLRKMMAPTKQPPHKHKQQPKQAARKIQTSNKRTTQPASGAAGTAGAAGAAGSAMPSHRAQRDEEYVRTVLQTPIRGKIEQAAHFLQKKKSEQVVAAAAAGAAVAVAGPGATASGSSGLTETRAQREERVEQEQQRRDTEAMARIDREQRARKRAVGAVDIDSSDDDDEEEEDEDEDAGISRHGIIGEVTAALADLSADDSIRCVVITGEGKAFCAGADLGDFDGVGGDPTGVTPGTNTSWAMLQRWNPMMQAFHDLNKPLVSAVNGVAAGGGVGIALVADVCVAAKSSKFVLTFGPNLGIVPDLGSTWQLQRKIGRGKALPLAMLGEPLMADEAERLGMVWKVSADDQVLADSLEIAKRLANAPTAAMVEIRHIIDKATQNTFAEQIDEERKAQNRLLDHPENPFKEASERFKEAARARTAPATAKAKAKARL
eukprot:g57.t1